MAQAMLTAAREQVGQVDFALHPRRRRALFPRTRPSPSEADIAGRLLPFAIPSPLPGARSRAGGGAGGAIDNATNNGVVGNGSGSFPYTKPGCASAIGPTGRKGAGSPTRMGEASPWPVAGGRGPMPSIGASSAYTASGKGYTALARTPTQHNQELSITLADAFIPLGPSPARARPAGAGGIPGPLNRAGPPGPSPSVGNQTTRGAWRMCRAPAPFSCSCGSAGGQGKSRLSCA